MILLKEIVEQPLENAKILEPKTLHFNDGVSHTEVINTFRQVICRFFHVQYII